MKGILSNLAACSLGGSYEPESIIEHVIRIFYMCVKMHDRILECKNAYAKMHIDIYELGYFVQYRFIGAA